MRKLLLILLVLMTSAAFAQTTVRCESVNNKMEDCHVGTGFVTMAHQLSGNDCIYGTSWGYDKGKIWVKEGCRAEFKFTERIMLTCESLNGEPGLCYADTTEGVRLVRRFSDSKCEFGRDWGWDMNGIWVQNGCRGEFAIRPATARATITTMTSSSTVKPATILCESKNNSRSHCRTDTRWGITLVRQVSDNACVRGKSWGHDSDGIWVDDGCRAEFTLGENITETPLVAAPVQVVVQQQPVIVREQPVIIREQPVIVQQSAPQIVAMPSEERVPTIMCESTDGRRNHCAVSTTNGVRLLRQTSDSNCVFNSTWGVDGNGVWVTNGCRGEFALGGMNVNDNGSTRVFCESKDGQRAVCSADTRAGIAVVRQVSDSPCVLNKTYGYDTEGIWVTAGCRAEFILRR
ncbi:MAG TPA: DUF3011 domain-containing protein [Thermoanaerobaculia bacterium]|nr:DUF3011 domain-containing protein [Thermoanaerobaculia bacterium]